MGNNGYGRDTILLIEMIHRGKKLPEIDHPWSVKGKIIRKLNKLVDEDEIDSYKWNGKKYDYHTSHRNMLNTITVINKLRQQNWFWEYLKL